jgi:excisionase family DNA binding protein
MKWLTTREAAEKLGISVRRVQAMVTQGRLPAEKFGRDYKIKETDLSHIKDRKTGRPPRAESKKR